MDKNVINNCLTNGIQIGKKSSNKILLGEEE